jgi:hypothetical protein
MTLGRLSVALVSVLVMGQTAKPVPSVGDLTRDLRAADENVRLAALRNLLDRGAGAAPAVPGLVSMLERLGRQDGTALDFACDILQNVGLAAAPALPVLVRFSNETFPANNQVIYCKENIAKAAGPAILPHVLRATAQAARGLWRADFDSPSGFITMRESRMFQAEEGFGGAARDFGPAALPYLETGLRDRDPFIRAQAAAFVEWLDLPAGKPALPALRAALGSERHPWPRLEMQWVIDRLEERPIK